MLPKIDALQSQPDRYKLLFVLQHREIADFVRAYIYSPAFYPRFFRAFLLLSFLAFLAYSIIGIYLKADNWDLYLYRFGLGVLSFFLLVPFHEIIHGLMYRFYGAKKVKYGVIWSKLAFFAIAPEFVVSKKEFIPLAIAPFLVINSLLIIGLGISVFNSEICFYLWGIFLMHSLGCMGDFALIGFFEIQGSRKIYTFDAKNGSSSYFYEDISDLSD